MSSWPFQKVVMFWLTQDPYQEDRWWQSLTEGPLETAETPVNLGVPIIARGVSPFPGLYSSGCLEPMAILLSQTSKGWNFRQEPPCPACGDPKRVPAGFIPHVDHAGPWISLGLTYMNGVSPRKNGRQTMWGLT